MKKVKIWFILAIIVGAFVLLWKEDSGFLQNVKQYVDNDEVLTLEAKYTPDTLMKGEAKKLITDDKHAFLEPSLRFYPYLLMDVKFTNSDKKTKEGILLWGMNDGEIVINTETWETTHGYTDCIEANAGRSDYKLIQVLETSGGSANRETLLQKLHIEGDVLDRWLASAIQKHLVVEQGSTYYLHLQSPKVCMLPQSKISQPLVTKQYSHALKMAKKYSKSDIEKSAIAAFGSDFAIRSTKEIYLPVYSIEISNPDGSIQTTYWNSLNGQRIYPK